VFVDNSRAGKRRRIATPTAIALMLILFALAFGATQYAVNRSLLGELIRSKQIESEKEASLSKRLDATKVQLAEETALANQADWLWRINYWRRMAGLLTVTEDLPLSDGDFKHARYLVKRSIKTNALVVGADGHSEDPSDPWYTPEGLFAGKHSDVIPAFRGEFSAAQSIDLWMSGPFHRLPILNRYLLRAGFGNYCEGGYCAAALDAQKDFEVFKPSDTAPVPVEFPSDNSSVPIGTFDGNEWPSPIASCPGFNPPIGYPITLQLDWRIVPKISAYSVTQAGQAIDVCGFDASDYGNPDASAQSLVRAILTGSGAVVLIPREPLTHGKTYTVSITASGETYTWHFSVS
jgi:hypothetical protein